MSVLSAAGVRGRQDNCRGILRTVQMCNHLFYRRGIIAGLHQEKPDSATSVSLVPLPVCLDFYPAPRPSVPLRNDCMIMSHDNVPHSSTSSETLYIPSPPRLQLHPIPQSSPSDHRVADSLNAAAAVETILVYSSRQQHSA